MGDIKIEPFTLPESQKSSHFPAYPLNPPVSFDADSQWIFGLKSDKFGLADAFQFEVTAITKFVHIVLRVD